MKENGEERENEKKERENEKYEKKGKTNKKI